MEDKSAALSAHTHYVHRPYIFKNIGGKRSHICIRRVTANKRYPVLKACHHQGVVQGLPALQKQQIPDIDCLKRRVFSERPDAAVACQKCMQKPNTRPRGGAVSGGIVIPPHIFCVVHHPTARKQALRREIGAVAAHAVKIKILRIARQCPLFRIGHGGRSVKVRRVEHNMPKI